MDADGAYDRRLRRTGEVVWSWHPDAGVKFGGSSPRTTVANKPGHRGEHEVSR